MFSWNLERSYNSTWTRDHLPRDDFHPTIECITTAFSCGREICETAFNRMIINSFLGKHTLISTSSNMMQFISLTPAAIRTFADTETSGPICLHTNQKVNTLETLKGIFCHKIVAW